MRSFTFSRKKSIIITSLISITVIFYILLFTRFGVFIVFDVLGDVRGTDNFTTTYRDAPVEVTRLLNEPKEIVIPTEIEQVSGIIAYGDHIILSTDQTEIFKINPDGNEIIAKSNLFPWTPILLRQGSLETITNVDNEFWLAGEYGAFLRADINGHMVGKHSIPAVYASTDITGLAVADGIGFLTISKLTDIPTINLSSGSSRLLKLDFSLVSDKPIADGELLWSGMAANNGYLFLVAENFPIIVVAEQTSGRVTEVLGIEGEHEFSDISVANGQIYLPSDHNFFDPRPPIRIFKLPEFAIRGT